MNRRWRHRRHTEQAELSITAFMNLMIILVPFLLITAVFSRTAILELNMPPAATGDNAEPPADQIQLEIIVRKDLIQVADQRGGPIGEPITLGPDGFDLEPLNELLKSIKARLPDKQDATLLLEPDVEYDVLVQVMDAVREFDAGTGAMRVRAELFPEIAIGDAPPRPTAVAQTDAGSDQP